MTPDHWVLALLTLATGLSMAWTMGRISANTRAIMASLERIEARAERIAGLVHALHRTR